MVEAGFSHEDGLQNYAILSLHTRGAITLTRQMALAGTAASAPRPVPADIFPHLAIASRSQRIRGVSEEEFVAHLKRMIEGMGALLKMRTES